MGRITTTVGLMSGLDIGSIVDQLMQLEARPRNILAERQSQLDAQRTAVMAIASQLMAIRTTASTIRNDYQMYGAQAASSNTAILDATAANRATPATYMFRVTRLVSTQQMLSTGYTGTETAVFSAGDLTIQSAKARLTDDLRLELLNGQQGVQHGSIRITDRTGASAVVDLSAAVTAGDVIAAINAASAISVEASVSGGRIILTDQTGQTTTNLSVTEVSGGSTAADLGILGSVAADTLTGSDVVTVGSSTTLAALNNGMGVRSVAGAADLRITLRDATQLDINLDGLTTLGGVIDAINNDPSNGGKLVAAVDASGKGLELTDTTGGGGTLAVTALNGSVAAHDLGILGSDGDADGVITGSDLLGGLQGVLLSRLNGGDGVDRGSISITDRNGVNSVIDLSAASTIRDVIDAINDAGVAADVTAALNSSGNGIIVSDVSGGAGAFIIADVGGTTMAADLGITVNDTVSEVQSGDLNRGFVNELTRLDTLNGGRGVGLGQFEITNSLGTSATIDLSSGDAETLQDVIDEINAAGIGVTARVNDTGDGLILEDTNGGGELLTVTDVSGSVASNLNIAGSAAPATTYIDGSSEVTIAVDAADTLTTLVAKINSSTAAVSAAILNDGSTLSPYRLSLLAERTGQSGALLIDAGTTGLSFSEVVRGADAVLSIGDGQSGEPLLITSTSNTVTGVIDNVTLDLVSAAPTQPVTVTVSSDPEAVISSLQTLVTDFNGALSKITTYTKYDAETQTGAVLQGDSTMITTQSRLQNFLFRSFSDTGSRYTTLTAIGFECKDGTLSLNEDKFTAAFAAYPDDVRDLLLHPTDGALKGLQDTMTQLAETGSGMLSIQSDRLQDQSDDYAKRIEQMDALLAMKRERLTNSFLAMERALAQLQSQQTALTSLAQLVSTWQPVKARSSS